MFHREGPCKACQGQPTSRRQTCQRLPVLHLNRLPSIRSICERTCSRLSGSRCVQIDVPQNCSCVGRTRRQVVFKWVGSRLYCCHVAIIDGEISEVALSNYKGQYVILFFYPKVCLQDCLCRAACMLQSITLSNNCLLRVACPLQSY